MNILIANLLFIQIVLCYFSSYENQVFCSIGCQSVEKINFIFISSVAESIQNTTKLIFTMLMSNKMLMHCGWIASIFLMFTNFLFQQSIVSKPKNYINNIIISWLINRFFSGILAAHREIILYNSKGVNIPAIKSLKAAGNIIYSIQTIAANSWPHLEKYICLTTIYSLGVVNIILNGVLGFQISKSNINIYQQEEKEKDGLNNTNNYNRFIFISCFIVFLMNICLVNDSIVYLYTTPGKAYILKLIGQLGFGIAYSLIFKNSKFIFILIPILSFFASQLLPTTSFYWAGCMSVGLLYTLRNSVVLIVLDHLKIRKNINLFICTLVDSIVNSAVGYLYDYLRGSYNVGYIFSVTSVISLITMIIIFFKIENNNKND